MRRLGLLCVFAITAAIVVACSSDSSSSTAPVAGALADRGGYHGYHHTRVVCHQFGDDVMQDLFRPPFRGIVRIAVALIRLEYTHGRAQQARNDMFHLWSDVLAAFYRGNLKGGLSADTQDNVLQFGQLMYCLVGLDGSGLSLGDALNTGDTTVVVYPSQQTQQVVHGDGDGGIQIPGGGLNEPATVTITLITDAFNPYQGPLQTKLDQYGPFFEFHVVPEDALGQAALVSQCLTGPSGGDPPPSVHLAHNVGTGIEILGLAAPFLDCNSDAMAGPSARDYFAHHDVKGAIRRLGEEAVALITPANAYAGSVGVGGKTTSFSPFGGVDTAVVVEATSPQLQNAPMGSDVPSPPTVRVRTTGAQTPLDGADVTFTVTWGGGTLGAGHTSSVGGVTDNTGTFGVTSWMIGVTGYDTVKATAEFPPPPLGGSVGIAGNPVVFAAVGGDILPYQATGYRYLAGAADHDQGFEVPSFNDGAWAVGQGGFADHTPQNPYCPIDAEANSPWASQPPPTDMLLRHGFTLPSGYSGDLKVGVAIDNDIEIWVDGNNVTGTGFVTHEGCATRDSFIFTIPNSALSTSTMNHVIAVRARDRGVAAYVDIRLYVPPPSP